MTIPYLHHHLFEINDNLEPKINHLGPYSYISIDNFYKRPDNIHDMFEASWVQSWKNDENGKNFRDYFDCRLSIPMRQHGFYNETKTVNYLKNLLNLQNYHCDKIDTNIFSWINIPDHNFQFKPHKDGSLNILVYLDKINSGGTALYRETPSVDVPEQIDIKFDLNNYKSDYYVIPSVFNRCVIFDGDISHGGYIDDHSKYSNGNWRYNTIYFLEPISEYNT